MQPSAAKPPASAVGSFTDDCSRKAVAAELVDVVPDALRPRLVLAPVDAVVEPPARERGGSERRYGQPPTARHRVVPDKPMAECLDPPGRHALAAHVAAGRIAVNFPAQP